MFITGVAQKILYELRAGVSDQLPELYNQCPGRCFCPEHGAGDRDGNNEYGCDGKNGIERQSGTTAGTPVIQPGADGVREKGQQPDRVPREVMHGGLHVC